MIGGELTSTMAPPGALASFTRKADALLSQQESGDECIIIQALRPGGRTRFYTFASVDSLAMAFPALSDCSLVNEIIRPGRQRKVFIDIDCSPAAPTNSVHGEDWLMSPEQEKAVHDAAKAASAEILPDSEMFASATGRGLHLVHPTWVTLAEHKEILDKFSSSFAEKLASLQAADTAGFSAAVDTQCLHQIRLLGTCKFKNPKRVKRPLNQHPGDGSVATLLRSLAQPPGAPPDMMTSDPGAVSDPERYYLPRKDIAVVEQILGAETDTFSQQIGTDGTVLLHRKKPGHCSICERTHDRAGAFVVTNRGSYKAMIGCHRALAWRPSHPYRMVSLSVNSASVAGKTLEEILSDPGPCNTRTFDEVTVEEPVPDTHYVDATPAGGGKTKRFWASVQPGDFVLFVSYRRSLSTATLGSCSRSGIDLADYRDFSKKDLRLVELVQQGKGGLVIQIDSFHKLKGQVTEEFISRVRGKVRLYVDEINSVARHAFQIMDPSSNSTDFQKNMVSCSVVTLCKAAKAIACNDSKPGQVVATDAGADDLAKAWVELVTDAAPQTRRISPQLIDADLAESGITRRKTVTFARSHHDLYKQLEKHFIALSVVPKEKRAKVAVFCHYKQLNRGDRLAVYTRKVADCARENGLRVLELTADVGEAAKKKFFLDPDGCSEQFDVVTYTSTLEAGVSIENPAFRSVYSFSGRRGSSEGEFQSICRARCAGHVFIAMTNTGGVPNEIQGKRLGAKTLKGLALQFEAAGYKFSMDSPTGVLSAIYHLERNRSEGVHYGARLARLFSDQGHLVEVAPHGFPPASSQLIDQLSSRPETSAAGPAPPPPAEASASAEAEAAEPDMGLDLDGRPQLTVLEEVSNLTPEEIDDVCSKIDHLAELAGADPREMSHELPDQTTKDKALSYLYRVARAFGMDPREVTPDFVRNYGPRLSQWSSLRVVFRESLNASLRKNHPNIETIPKGLAGETKKMQIPLTTSTRERVSALFSLAASAGFCDPDGSGLLNYCALTGAEKGSETTPKKLESAEFIGEAAELYSRMKRVFPELKPPKSPPATRRASISLLRSVCKLFGLELSPTNPKNPARGLYNLGPAKDFPPVYKPAARQSEAPRDEKTAAEGIDYDREIEELLSMC